MSEPRSKKSHPVGPWFKRTPLSDLAYSLMTVAPSESGDGVILRGVTVEEVRELGARIHEVLAGNMTAAKAIQQPKRRRGAPTDRARERIPVEYYRRLAKDGPSQAGNIAKELAVKYGKSAATIERIARANQQWALDDLSRAPGIAELTAHLSKKAKGGNKPK